MHAPDCRLCSTLTPRAAYRYLGIPNIIPISHGASHLARDLHETLRDLSPGTEATFDYEGEVSPAPRVTITMEPDTTLTARFTRTDGTVTTMRHPAVGDEAYPPMVTAVLHALNEERKCPGVVIVDGSDV